MSRCLSSLFSLVVMWLGLKWVCVVNCNLCVAAGECQDSTRYCEKVRQLELCPLPQFKSRCCHSCRNTWGRDASRGPLTSWTGQGRSSDSQQRLESSTPHPDTHTCLLWSVLDGGTWVWRNVCGCDQLSLKISRVGLGLKVLRGVSCL